jgi:hypothetical protein
MFPIVLEGSDKLWASVFIDTFFTFVCTYIEGEQINTIVETPSLSASGTILLEAPTTGSRIIRQVILRPVFYDNTVTLLLGDSPPVPIARFFVKRQHTLTLGGVYDASGRLNVTSFIGDFY